jgi:hypothetical protein
MKGLVSMSAVALCLAGVLAAGGCYGYRDLVDPCYPIRYNYMARQEVNAAFAPQVQNGHVLDQTVWNYYFEPGTDRLTQGGLDRLAYVARRRPCPDTTLYLQTAQDVVYDPTAPEKMVESRQLLDLKRIQAVQNYLTAQTAGRPVQFHVCIHDPAEVDLAAIPVNSSVNQMYARFRGGLLIGGAGAVGGSGAIQGAPAGIGNGTGAVGGR